MFSLDKEANVPTTFSSLVLLSSSAVLYLIAAEKKRVGDVWRRHWAGLSALFFLIAFDESAAVHGRMIKPIRKFFGTGDYFYYAWVIPALLLALVLAVLYFRFFFSLPHGTRWRFVLSAALFLGGGIGLEMVAGHMAFRYGTPDVRYMVLTHLEEIMELTASIFFLRSLLDYLSGLGKNGRLEAVFNFSR